MATRAGHEWCRAGPAAGSRNDGSRSPPARKPVFCDAFVQLYIKAGRFTRTNLICLKRLSELAGSKHGRERRELAGILVVPLARLLAVAACILLSAAEAKASVRDVCRAVADQTRSEPFVEVLNAGYLTFLATRHSVDPKSETFRLVEDVIRGGAFDVVLVEASPDEETSSVVNEAQYASQTAAALGLPVVRADLGQKATRGTLAQWGVSELDIVASLTLRHISAKAQVGRYDPGKFTAQVAASLAQMQEGRFGRLYVLDDVLGWYRNSYGLAADADSEFTRRGQPCRRGRAGQVLALLTNARNVHLASLIARHMARAQKVLVVYGAGHYFPIQDAFGDDPPNRLVADGDAQARNPD